MPDSSSPHKAESQMTLASARSSPEDSHRWYNKKRSTAEKVLLVTIFFSIFVVIGLSVSLAAVISGYQLAKQLLVNSTSSHNMGLREKICFSTACIKAASNIMDRIDTSENPCDNFYKFACGTYEKNEIIPDEKTAVTQFSLIQDALQQKLRQVIDENVYSNDSSATILVKNLFKSCMNVERIEHLGTEPLKRVLAEMGGWPVVEGSSWDPSTFEWTTAIYKNRKLGYSVDYFIDFSVTVNVKNSSWRIIDLDQPPLGMPSRKYLLKGVNDSEVQAYHDYQVSLAVMLGADEEAAKKELLEALQFEIQLANYSMSSEDRRDISKLYNKMTIRELEEMTPEIPWLEYINTLLPSSIKVKDDEPVVVNVPKYIKKFAKLITNTDKRIVANFLMWRVASASVGFLSNSVRDVQLKYSKKLTGKGTRAPRWKECMGAVSGSLSHAVGALYAKRFFNKAAKEQADNMVSYIKSEFNNILRTIDWMDESTLAKALHKSEAIKAHIGYPDEILVDQNLKELYNGLHINGVYLLENMRNLTIFGTDFSFGELRKKVDKHHWRNHGSAAVVNAFYSPLENSIQFPAGILQGVFYGADRPWYLNFGGIGFVIGHEITHGFDDKGRQFDENGNLKNWWDAGTQEKFIQRSKCMIYQYGNYTEPQVNISINGLNTLGENIADNGGIKEAYRAYQQWVDDHGEEKMLPGLDYTPNQLFWISSAHVWCSKYRPESMKLRVITGSHPPVMFRVNGPLSNINEFSDDWKCKRGTNMNPHHKCTVW